MTCSSDLHSIVDCNTHQVIKTCPANTGCNPNGQCVAPCDSAATNHSSVGCEYYAINPDAFSPNADAPSPSSNHAGGCFVVFVANTWTSAVTLGAEFDGQSLDLTQSAYLPQGSGSALSYMPLAGGVLAENQIAIVFLAQHAGSGGQQTLCPSAVHVAYTASDPAIHGTGLGHAFRLTASAPVVAYDIYPYGGASSQVTSATLLLPTSVWDTNYIATSAYQPESDGYADANLVFVASQDQTTLTINPTSAIQGGPNVTAAPQGMPMQYTLNGGESLQLSQLNELSGSAVLADKPIGVWGGHWGMYIPHSGSYVPGVDAAHQQLPPVKALGNEYVAVRYRNRSANATTDESVPWRIVGAVNGTALSYEPSAPAGAPSTLSRGQVVEFESAGPFVVLSQDNMHPFYFAGHMTGGSLAGGLGDPETVNVIPPQQFLDHYVFFTDPTYQETNLVIVRPHSSAQDVSLDCLGSPVAGWQPVGARYDFTRVDLQHAGSPVSGCDNGRHVIKSSAPFGVTVWGFDQYVSYAYPAGAAVRPINSVVVQPDVPR
jgi:hypothetical protein